MRYYLNVLTGVLLAVVIMCLACDNIVVGENPIYFIGDVGYVFPLEGDEFNVYLRSSSGSIKVIREYEGYTVEFYESIPDNVEKIIVTMPSGNMYPIKRIRSRDYDDVYSRIEFYGYNGYYTTDKSQTEGGE